MIYAHSPQIDYIAHKTCKTIYYNKEKTLQIRLLYPFVEDINIDIANSDYFHEVFLPHYKLCFVSLFVLLFPYLLSSPPNDYSFLE